MKILIAEDNDDNWDMISRRLIKRGFDVERAIDGREAVEKAIASAYDVILMDVNLPTLDGLGATRRIRERRTEKQLPIIALTAHALSGDRDKALAAGCNDYHTKPVEIASLLEQIRALTQERESGDAL